MVIGILGGIGSGKSAVARLLAGPGGEVVDADQLAHEVLRRAPVRERVAARFGPATLGADGEVDRGALAREVFGDPAALADLEALIHPAVREEILARVRAHRSGGEAGRFLVLDVPLLAESSLAGECDRLVFVEAPEEIRRRRTGARGWEPEEIARREARQLSLAAKRAMASHRIDNGGAIEETERAAAALREALLADAAGRLAGAGQKSACERPDPGGKSAR